MKQRAEFCSKLCSKSSQVSVKWTLTPPKPYCRAGNAERHWVLELKLQLTRPWPRLMILVTFFPLDCQEVKLYNQHGNSSSKGQNHILYGSWHHWHSTKKSVLELPVRCLTENKQKSWNFPLRFPLTVKFFFKNGIKKVGHLSLCALRAQVLKRASDDPF